MNNKPLIIAHRGASAGAVENSLEAFERAISAGADMIEFDVRRTFDDELIAFHDADVNGRPVRQLRRAEIAEAVGHTPPLLDDVLHIARGRMRLDVELKENGYVDRVLDAVASQIDPEQLLVTSFIDDVVLRVKERLPEAKAGLLLGIDKPKRYLRTRISEIFPISRARACRADYLAPHFKLADLGVLSRARDADLPCLVWTVNEDEMISRFLRDTRVGGVITDVPERALALRTALTSPARGS